MTDAPEKNDDATTDDAPNEILAEVKAHARAAERAVAAKTRNWPLARLGIGAAIGSAAVAAAVLFARGRNDRDG